MFAYLNDALPADERARFEAMLAARPDLRAELADWQALRGELEMRKQERAPEAGLDAFARRMRASRPQARSGTGIGALIERWVRPLYSPMRYAAALLLVVVQAGVITAMLSEPGPEQPASDPLSTRVRSINGAPAASLRARFKPEATAREIASTLSNVGARIADGPGQGGFYVLSVPAGSRAAAVSALRESRIIDEIVEAPDGAVPKIETSPGR